MDKFISSLSHKVVCVSSSVANVRLKLGIDNVKKQYFLGNGTCGGIYTKTKFNPNNINDTLLNALLDKYNIKNDTFIVGFCGRLVRDKGIIELVDAFHLLINDNPNKNIKLLIIGTKEIRDSIPEETIEILNNNANIIFTGYIPYDNIQ